jgi:hypothetical protein
MRKKQRFLQFALACFIVLIVIASSFPATILPPRIEITSLFRNYHHDKSTILPINPKDDAFHGSTPFPSVEWWYFDSMFNQNYSVHVGFRIITCQGFNLLKPAINIYHKQQLIVNETIILPPTAFDVSEKYPEITIQNDPVMVFNKSYYEHTGGWKYHLSYFLHDVGIDLTFSSETMGWSYVTPHEGWTVAIPQGIVNGYIYLDDQKIAVNGRGYHDHNWNFSLATPARGWSWYWGKITGETLNLAWAEIKETGILEQTFTDSLGVLNTQKNEFIVIDPQNISFSADSFIFRDNRFIPTLFHITINQDDVYVDVRLTSKTIHRSDPSMMTLHYWRYFVSVTGVISYGDTTEQIHEKTQIMEYMRFI